MQYTVSPERMQALEQHAFSQGVSALLLMEHAAQSVVAALEKALYGVKSKRVLIVCGMGNNGGDGLAAARMLLQRGCKVKLYLLGEPKTDEAQVNFAYLKALSPDCTEIINAVPDMDGYDAVIDAIFGMGFHGAPDGLNAEVINKINASNAPVKLSVDIPSGMNGETGTTALCVHATHTVTLGFAKLGLYLTNQKSYVGKLTVAPLQLPNSCTANGDWPGAYAEIMEESTVKALLAHRAPDTHKGIAGRVLLYAGSMGMAGAATMAAKAALRAGAGLVTVACPKDIIPILQQSVPNAMCMDIDDAVQHPPRHDVLAVGCGLGKSKVAQQHLLTLLQNEKAPVILDADALNMLAKTPFFLPVNAILTPHIGEAARLLSISVEEAAADMLKTAQQLHQKFGALIVLKSACTVIYDGKTFALNAGTVPALAKGGSGDALCGILAALMADQGLSLSPISCTQTACLWHGMAGRFAAARFGERSTLTGDVINALGSCLLH